MKKIRVLLADDHSLMRFGLTSLIDSEKDMSVVGAAKDGEEAVSLARQLKPDLIVMDLMMPELSGAEATRRIHEELPKTRILILTSYGTSADMMVAVTNGASGALLKDTATDKLVDAIRAVNAGKKVFPSHVLKLIRQDAGMPLLTDRQTAILASVTRGLTNADIARQFNITEIGVKKHLSAIFEKIGAANRTEAVSIALRKHLLKT